MRVLCLVLTLWASSAHATEFFIHWTDAALKEMDRVTAKYWPDENVKASTSENYQFVKLEMGLTLGDGKFEECFRICRAKDGCGYYSSRPHLHLGKEGIRSGDTRIHPTTPLVWQDSDNYTTKIKFKPTGITYADADYPDYDKYAYPDAPDKLGVFWRTFLANPRLEFKLTYNNAVTAEDQFPMPHPTTFHFNATDFPERTDIIIPSPRIRQGDHVLQIDFDETGFHFVPFTNKNPTSKTTEPSGDFYIAVSMAARDIIYETSYQYDRSLSVSEKVEAKHGSPLFNLKVQADDGYRGLFTFANLYPGIKSFFSTHVPWLALSDATEDSPYHIYKMSIDTSETNRKWMETINNHEWIKGRKFFFEMNSLDATKPYISCALPDRLGVHFTQENFPFDPDFETYTARLNKGDMVLLLDYNNNGGGHFFFRTFTVTK